MTHLAAPEHLPAPLRSPPWAGDARAAEPPYLTLPLFAQAPRLCWSEEERASARLSDDGRSTRLARRFRCSRCSSRRDAAISPLPDLSSLHTSALRRWYSSDRRSGDALASPLPPLSSRRCATVSFISAPSSARCMSSTCDASE